VAKSAKPERISGALGPFTYGYISVLAVPGVRISDKIKDPVPIKSFLDLGAEAFLTQDWDFYCSDFDRSAAIGSLLLSGFRGERHFRKISTVWDKLLRFCFGGVWVFNKNLARETRAARERRHKEHSGPGCYLIYKAEGELLEPVSLNNARRFGNIGFGFDVINAEQYQAVHAKTIHSAATSLSLALADTTGSPDAQFIGDIIYLKGKDGIVIYCKSIEFGPVGLVVTKIVNSDIISNCNYYLPNLLKDNKMENSVRLFIKSQRKSNDNLRAFIFAWSALELLVYRLEKVNRDVWTKMLNDDFDSLPAWDKDLTDVCSEDYRLRDRFFAVACVLNLNSAEKDSERFCNANKIRNGFYHTGKYIEKDLPTGEAQSLFREYLKLGFALGKTAEA